MSQEIIESNGRYMVVRYTRWHAGPRPESRYLVIDRDTRSVVGAPLGYPDEHPARRFARELNNQPGEATDT